MTDKLPEPNTDRLTDAGFSEEELKKKYPCLAIAPKEDWLGILKRAEREGVPVEQLKLRELSPPAGINIREPDKDIPGILDRSIREDKPVSKLNLRGRDSIRDIYTSMYYMLAKAGFPVREYFEEEGAPVTKRYLRTIPPESDEESGNK